MNDLKIKRKCYIVCTTQYQKPPDQTNPGSSSLHLILALGTNMATVACLSEAKKSNPDQPYLNTPGCMEVTLEELKEVVRIMEDESHLPELDPSELLPGLSAASPPWGPEP